MATVQAERVRRFTSGELALMRARGVLPADEPIELVDGRLMRDGMPRPIWPDEAIRMVEAEIFAPDERVELIDGALWIVSPQGLPHGWVVVELGEVLRAAYAGVAKVPSQQPTRVVGPSLPEPDLLVVRPYEEYRPIRADDLLLAVEVTVTSHRRDARKVPIYATAGVCELWLVDVPARAVTIHTDPRPEGTWGTIRRAGEDEPLALPETDATLTLRQVLPPA